MTERIPLRSTPEEAAIDKHVGERIRVRRLIMKMTQEDLAKACGITFQQHQRYEHGTNRVSASRLYQLSKVLAVEPGYFFEDPPGSKSDLDPMKASRAVELVLYFNQVSARDQTLGALIFDMLRRISGADRTQQAAVS